MAREPSKDALAKGIQQVIAATQIPTVVPLSNAATKLVALRFGIDDDEAGFLAWQILTAIVDVGDASAGPEIRAARHLLGRYEYPSGRTSQIPGTQVTLECLQQSNPKTFSPTLTSVDVGMATHRKAVALVAGGYGTGENGMKADARRIAPGKVGGPGFWIAAELTTRFLAELSRLESDGARFAELRSKAAAARTARTADAASDAAVPSVATVNGPQRRETLRDWREWGHRRAWAAVVVVATAAVASSLIVRPWDGGDPPAAHGRTSFEFEGSMSARNLTTKRNLGAGAAAGDVQLGDELDLSVSLTNNTRQPIRDGILEIGYLHPGGGTSSAAAFFTRLQTDQAHSFALTDGAADVMMSPDDNCVVGDEPLVDKAWERRGRAWVTMRPQPQTASDDAHGTVMGDGQPEDILAAYPIDELAPGAAGSYRIRVIFWPNEASRSAVFEGGANTVVLRSERGEYTSMLAAKPGDVLEVSTQVDDTTCNLDGTPVVVRAAFKPDRAMRNTSLEVSANGQKLGGSTINFEAGASRLSVVPGSMFLFGEDPRRRCEVTRLRRLPDGVAQGGVVIGAVPGYTPHGKCGTAASGRFVNFAVRVE